ncbi:hypothetical protein BaRGS_00005401, partial [Batillaria attramentaria]
MGNCQYRPSASHPYQKPASSYLSSETPVLSAAVVLQGIDEDSVQSLHACTLGRRSRHCPTFRASPRLTLIRNCNTEASRTTMETAIWCPHKIALYNKSIPKWKLSTAEVTVVCNSGYAAVTSLNHCTILSPMV